MNNRMLQALESLDERIFLFLNGIHNPFWDEIMYWISNRFIWIPLYLFILVWLYKILKNRFWILLPFLILLVALSDQISVHLFKNVFQRLRPCHNEDIKSVVHLVRNHCGGLYGFVSSHASNAFAVALFTLFIIRNRWFSAGILLWAILTAYSRIYLGVHYPGDVLAGSLLGALIGWLVWWLWKLSDGWLRKHWKWYRGAYNLDDKDAAD